MCNGSKTNSYFATPGIYNNYIFIKIYRAELDQILEKNQIHRKFN